MTKTKTILVIFILTIALTTIFPLTTIARQIDPSDYKSNEPNAEETKDLYKFGGSIAGFVQICGTIVSAGSLIIIGIRYVASSVEEKAEYKERMFPYIIGALLLFGASNVVKIIYKIVS